MFRKVLFIQILLLHYTTPSETEVFANCYEDFPVMCPAVDIDSINFSSLTWYKLHKTKRGIIKRERDNTTKWYKNFDRSPKPRFGEKHSLLIPRVTPEDSGTYECDIYAKVGGQNLDFKVHLKVHDCVNDTDVTTVVNTSQPDLQCHKQDMPVMWSIIGYVAVGLAKIILSFISVWVVHAVRTRSSRRRRHEW
ncbi:uncharacterized protein [Clinocottus analis]|uniref:uncharacterized protein n=1 Tax=Clinocottus analis TaxID=304258 RepID=UPI0035C0E0F2